MDIATIAFADARKTGIIVTEKTGRRHTLPWPCRTWHAGVIKGWREDGGEIAPYAAPPTTAADIKAEAARRIMTRYPEWKQRNMTARGVELLHIQAGRSWTPDEQAEADALQAAWDWIGSVRAASDTLEAAQPIPADWRDDPHWPIS